MSQSASALCGCPLRRNASADDAANEANSSLSLPSSKCLAMSNVVSSFAPSHAVSVKAILRCRKEQDCGDKRFIAASLIKAWQIIQSVSDPKKMSLVESSSSTEIISRTATSSTSAISLGDELRPIIVDSWIVRRASGDRESSRTRSSEESFGGMPDALPVSIQCVTRTRRNRGFPSLAWTSQRTVSGRHSFAYSARINPTSFSH